MLNYVWFFMILASVFYAVFSGNIEALSVAVMDGASKAVELSIFLLGSMCAWLGFLKIAEKSGLTLLIAKVLSPIINRLFPEYRDNYEIKGKICMNLSANLLGIGNAATPLGLAAMTAMQAENRTNRPTKGMMLFVIINTASLQILPINMAAIRSSAGSAAPFSVLPHIWITSLSALLICITAAKMCERSSLWKH
ncbi:nucleoside recognition domain-containing protein [Scatolibacter rhodanostii]|uniref:nucleoside recognition domain-containing protein n=1 Tax=Scatolibacter rhodanostii TaxID=2014781 RepID=UPI000C07A63A|nr:nucleoside recognition domain-containing protein [Scatolibacter rhodanostii]